MHSEIENTVGNLHLVCKFCGHPPKAHTRSPELKCNGNECICLVKEKNIQERNCSCGHAKEQHVRQGTCKSPEELRLDCQCTRARCDFGDNNGTLVPFGDFRPCGGGGRTNDEILKLFKEKAKQYTANRE